MHCHFLALLRMITSWSALSQLSYHKFRGISWFFLRVFTTLCTFVGLREEFVLFDLIRLNCFITRLPVGWAYLTMLVSVLETLNQSYGFGNISTHSIIIDLHTAHNMLVVEDEHATY